jgi:hypothetical protein
MLVSPQANQYKRQIWHDIETFLATCIYNDANTLLMYKIFNQQQRMRMTGLLSATAILLLAGSAIIYQVAAQTSNQTEIELPTGNMSTIEEVVPLSPLKPDILMAPHSEIPALNGSVNITGQLASYIIASANVSLGDAAVAAASSVADGRALQGNLGTVQGFLAYTFQVMDRDGRLYTIIVDAGNGQILHKSEPMQLMLNSPLIDIMKVESREIIIPGPHIAELFHHYSHIPGPLAKSVMPAIEEEGLEVR